MAHRTLTITRNPDWPAALHEAGDKACADTYQGETLNFETTAQLFTKLTALRWELVRLLQEAGGALGLRELARRAGRDPSRVRTDVTALVDLGLVERTANGGVLCPYADIHLDMHTSRRSAA